MNAMKTTSTAAKARCAMALQHPDQPFQQVCDDDARNHGGEHFPPEVDDCEAADEHGGEPDHLGIGEVAFEPGADRVGHRLPVHQARICRRYAKSVRTAPAAVERTTAG